MNVLQYMIKTVQGVGRGSWLRAFVSNAEHTRPLQAARWCWVTVKSWWSQVELIRRKYDFALPEASTSITPHVFACMLQNDAGNNVR